MGRKVTDQRFTLFFSGILIIAYNLYWLIQFEMAWNLFTYESWVMLVVGLLFVFPAIKGNSKGDPFVQYGAYFLLVTILLFAISMLFTLE